MTEWISTKFSREWNIHPFVVCTSSNISDIIIDWLIIYILTVTWIFILITLPCWEKSFRPYSVVSMQNISALVKKVVSIEVLNSLKFRIHIHSNKFNRTCICILNALTQKPAVATSHWSRMKSGKSCVFTCFVTFDVDLKKKNIDLYGKRGISQKNLATQKRVNVSSSRT